MSDSVAPSVEKPKSRSQKKREKAKSRLGGNTPDLNLDKSLTLFLIPSETMKGYPTGRGGKSTGGSFELPSGIKEEDKDYSGSSLTSEVKEGFNTKMSSL